MRPSEEAAATATAADAHALRVSDLLVIRGGNRVLQGLDLNLLRGESIAVLGRNGAGKTTLAHAIAGLLPSVRGRISIFGSDITGQPAHKVAKRGVALVPEGRALFSNMTVLENLALGAHTDAWRWGGPTGAAYETVFSIFPALESLQRRRAGTLSGGEQQMVAVGRALMSAPQLLILDEPSAGLSPQAVDAMGSHLSRLHDQGYSVLLIEQNADLALSVCDEVAVLSRGKIVTRGGPHQVVNEPSFVEALFGDPAAAR